MRDDLDEEEATERAACRLVAVSEPADHEHAGRAHRRPEDTHPPSTINGLHRDLATAVRRGAGDRPPDNADVTGAVEGALWLHASGRGDEAAAAATRAGRAVAAMAEAAAPQSYLPGAACRPVNWSPFGSVLPVLAGSPGAGASVVAVALADALQQAGRCVLVVDAADPARSGLALAAAAEGPWTRHPHDAVTVRYSWRDRAVLARLESTLPMVSPGMVPPPPAWLPELSPLHATVIDVGHDGWRACTDPLLGAGGWLRIGSPAPRPLLVVRPTRPSLRHAEQVLARLDPWVAAGVAIPPCQLVVNGSRRWPAGVAGAAGRRLLGLLPTAIFVPHDRAVEIGGITDAPLPRRLVDAVRPLLSAWGLLPPAGHPLATARTREGRR